MSVLSILEAVPNRVRMLASVIAQEGDLTRAELQKRIVPSAEKSDQFNNLLRETSRLGLVSENKKTKTISLGQDIDKKTLSSKTGFNGFCHHALISEKVPKSSDNYSFPRALAWFLTRPVGMNTPWGSEYGTLIQTDLDGDNIYDLTNASRSQMLGYWCHFLGYAEWINWEGKKFLNPDPTRALQSLATEICEKNKPLAFGTFLKKVRELSPVFETGAIRNEIEKRLKTKRGDQTLSTSTSLALFRLRERGMIELDQPSDADPWLITDISGASERISRLTLTRKGGK